LFAVDIDLCEVEGLGAMGRLKPKLGIAGAGIAFAFGGFGFEC
jgi:hypothetical protein